MQNELERLRLRNEELERQLSESEKKRMEAEDRFYRLFHASSNSIAIASIKDGRLIDLNEASANLGGFNREELMGTVGAEFELWADPNQRDAIIEKVMQEGSVHNAEVALRTRNGDTRAVLFSANPISVDEEPCLLCVAVDITAHEMATIEIKRSEGKYRALVENSLQGFSIIQDGRFVFCNNALAAMTGYSVEELMAFPDSKDLVHPEDQAMVQARRQNRVDSQPIPARHEHRIIRKDGAIRWVEVLASSIEYNGRPAIQVVNMDITERREADAALRESEERFHLIAETIDEIFWIFDLEKMAAVYISPARERIWGYPREPFSDSWHSFLNSIHPEDAENVRASVAAMMSGQTLDSEYRIIRPDGDIRYIWERGYPVRDGSGHIRKYVGVGQDITSRKQAENDLRASREYLNQIINCIGDFIFVKDSQHRFMLANDAMCAFTGRSRGELLGKSHLGHLPKTQVDSLLKQEEGVLVTGKECVTEEILPDANGNSHTILSKKTLLLDKNGNRQIVGVLRDITEYKRLQAQLNQSQKMEAVGMLAGGVAHDFNNLLTVIKGYAEIMQKDLGPQDPHCYDLEQILLAANQAATLTTQLLAFSRKQILQPEILDLNTSILSMSSMLRRLIGEDIDFVTETQPDLGLIHADPGQIQQILLNLAVNARDAMPQGGQLTIETANAEFDEDYVRDHPLTKPGSYVMLAVSDSGVGIDPATQARLFEPFLTTKEKGKGTGLGLPTVYGIVKQSEGFIWVYSEVGKGATFKIYFPRVAGQTPETKAEGKAESRFEGTETVLVVEDEASVRALTSRILLERGYIILQAANGHEALEIAKKFEGKIDLLITDVVMPGMGGKALVSQLKAARPDIKVLYVSGYTDNAIVHHGILDSGVAFLQKPFTVDSLIRKVRAVINS